MPGRVSAGTLPLLRKEVAQVNVAERLLPFNGANDLTETDHNAP